MKSGPDWCWKHLSSPNHNDDVGIAMAVETNTAACAESQFKTCSRCGEAKPATTEFFNKKLNGLTSLCRDCRNSVRRAEYAAMSDEEREALNARRRADRASDPDRFRELDKKRYARRKSEQIEYNRKRRAANPEEFRRRSREQYLKNRERRLKQARAWARRNRDRRREAARRLHARRQATSPQYRVNRAMSAHIRWSIAKSKGGQRWERLVGYTLKDLMEHLERQFSKGMTWENYGKWHVDHIIPLSSFEYTSPDDPEFKACWALTNLRPLWARENIRKRDKRTLLL